MSKKIHSRDFSTRRFIETCEVVHESFAKSQLITELMLIKCADLSLTATHSPTSNLQISVHEKVTVISVVADKDGEYFYHFSLFAQQKRAFD